MKHLTTIEHGPNRYILLPYAAYGDLEIFLHCGIAPDGETKYDFNSIFPGVKTGDVTMNLLNECGSLAHALEWLHNQIKIEPSSNSIFCAHMDLKPANILISPDAGSLVGKWMISDFGISVFKEETQQPDPNYGSIGDYVSQVTMNTRPKRQEGTYQAPEVKIAESIFSQSSHLTPEQRGIGRKSDIWSFGCILSEVLAFALGKEDLVRSFQSVRKQNAGDDYFYAEKVRRSSQYLRAADSPNESPKEYEVRPAVLWWLEDIRRNSASPQEWVKCYVGTVREILIVDTTQRPDAIELLKLLRHVKEHVKYSTGSSIVHCPILNPKGKRAIASSTRSQANPAQIQHQPPAPSPTQAQRITRKPLSSTRAIAENRDGGTSLPMIFRSSTIEQEPIHDYEDNIGSKYRSHLDAHDPESQMSNAHGNNVPSTPMPSQDNGDNPRPGPHPIQEDNFEPDCESRTGSGSKSSLFSSFAKPRNAHGVVVDRAVPMSPKPSNCVDLPKIKNKSLKMTSMALTRSNDGARFACLAKSSVYIYKLRVEELSVVLDQEIRLAAHSGWQEIAIAGNFIAAWGFLSSKAASGKVVSWSLMLSRGDFIFGLICHC